MKQIRYSLNVIQTEKPSLAKSQVRRYPEEEGRNLPNSIEDMLSLYVKKIQVEQTMGIENLESWK